MSTISSNLKMILPQGPDLVDIDQLVADLSKIDTEAGYVICTSTTRPLTPYLGQKILETDSKATYVWEGTKWMFIGGGLLSKTGRAADAVIPTGVWSRMFWSTDFIPANVSGARASLFSIKAVYGGVYKIEGNMYFTDSAQANVGIRSTLLKKNSLGSISTGATIRQSGKDQGAVGFNNEIYISAIAKLVAGDDIDMWVFQASGVNQTIPLEEVFTFFQMRQIG